MTSEQFNAWLEMMELGVKEAAEELRVSVRSVTSWKNGKKGPKWLPLLCAAVTYGLKPWRITPPASKIGLYDPLADVFIQTGTKRK